MKTVLGMGTNRTGIGTSPVDARASVEGAAEGVPVADVDGTALAALRGDYVREAEPIGTVPPPTSVKGAVKAVGELLTGKRVTVLLDKLSERLAFERTGTRMYEGLIAKLEASGDADPAVLEDARRFHGEERAHMDLVARSIEQLGGDPTVETPSADVDGVASMGLLQVIADPRTSTLHSLHAIHIAELADNDGWSLLVDLAERMGQSELAEAFREALAQEAEHLATVRRWTSTAVLDAAE